IGQPEKSENVADHPWVVALDKENVALACAALAQIYPRAIEGHQPILLGIAPCVANAKPRRLGASVYGVTTLEIARPDDNSSVSSVPDVDVGSRGGTCGEKNRAESEGSVRCHPCQFETH